MQVSMINDWKYFTFSYGSDWVKVLDVLSQHEDLPIVQDTRVGIDVSNSLVQYRAVHCHFLKNSA